MKKFFLLLAALLGVSASNAAVADYQLPEGLTVTGFEVNAENDSFSTFSISIGKEYLGTSGSVSLLPTFNNTERGTLVLPDGSEVKFKPTVPQSTGNPISYTFATPYTTPGDYTLKIDLTGARYMDGSFKDVPADKALIEIPFSIAAPWTMPEGVTVKGFNPNAGNDSFASFSISFTKAFFGTSDFQQWLPSSFTGSNRGTLVLPDGTEVKFSPSASGKSIGYTFDPVYTTPGEYKLKIDLSGAKFMVVGFQEVPAGTVLEIPFTINEEWSLRAGVVVTGFNVNAANESFSSFKVDMTKDYFPPRDMFQGWKSISGSSFDANNQRGTLTLPDGTDVKFDLQLSEDQYTIQYTFDPAYTTPGDYLLTINLNGAKYLGNGVFRTLASEGNVFTVPFSIAEAPAVPVVKIDGNEVSGNYQLQGGQTATVTITSDVKDAEIFYKWTDALAAVAAEATDEFMKYEAPVEVASNGTLEYYAVAPDGLRSATGSVVFSVETGISGIDAENGQAKYYDIHGRRVVNPENGIFVKVVDGKASKVLVK